MLASLLKFPAAVSAFGLVSVSSEQEYSRRPLRVMADGNISIDQGEILDANILPNSSLTINGQLIHYDQGLFLHTGWHDLLGQWSTDGFHLLYCGHSRFLICPEHWYGIAYAGVAMPTTCVNPVEVLLKLTDSPSANDLGSGYAFSASPQNNTIFTTTADSLNPVISSSTSSFTIPTFSVDPRVRSSSTSDSGGYLIQTHTQSSNSAARLSDAVLSIFLGLLL